MSAAPIIEINTRERRGQLDSPWGHRLRKLEERIVGNEGDSIEARWEFGRTLLEHRVGKQLPKGVLTELVKASGVGRDEIQKRMRFAEQFTTKAEVHACACTYTTWNQIKRKALPKAPRTPKATTFEQQATDRVTRLINDAKTPANETLAQILLDAAQQLTESTDV